MQEGNQPKRRFRCSIESSFADPGDKCALRRKVERDAPNFLYFERKKKKEKKRKKKKEETKKQS